LSITKLSKPSPSFDVFQNTVFESLDTEKKECFEICEVYEVNNSCLQHKVSISYFKTSTDKPDT